MNGSITRLTPSLLKLYVKLFIINLIVNIIFKGFITFMMMEYSDFKHSFHMII